MRRILLVLTVVALLMVMLAMAVGPALATQPLENKLNGRGDGAFNSNNCVSYNSSRLMHNGSAVRDQVRQTEVKGMQASCNNANQK